MRIIHEVIDFFAISPELDNPHLAQAAQMMGHCRFSHTNQLSKLRNVHFSIHDYGKNPNPAGIAESSKQLCHMGCGVLV